MKIIPNTGGRYSITKDGRVFSNNRKKYLKGSIKNNGYIYVCLWLGYKHSVHIHKLVAEAYLPNPNNLPQINHKDGNKMNNHADNLEWCTASHNMRHSWASVRDREAHRVAMLVWHKERRSVRV